MNLNLYWPVLTRTAAAPDSASRQRGRTVLLLGFVIVGLLAGCATKAPSVGAPAVGSVEAHASLECLVPSSVSDRKGWIADMYVGFTVQHVVPTPQTSVPSSR